MDRICGPAHPHKIRTDNQHRYTDWARAHGAFATAFALWPTPVIGGRLLAPTTAANVVMMRLSNHRWIGGRSQLSLGAIGTGET